MNFFGAILEFPITKSHGKCSANSPLSDIEDDQ